MKKAGNRFEELSKVLGAPISRRRMLKFAAGAVGGAAVSPLLFGNGGAAAAGGTCISNPGGIFSSCAGCASSITCDGRAIGADCNPAGTPGGGPGVCVSFCTAFTGNACCTCVGSGKPVILASFSPSVSGGVATITVTDPTGLASVWVPTCSNCTASVSASSGCPTATQVVVTATKVDTSRPASIEVDAAACDGKVSVFDPVMVNVTRDPGTRDRQVLTSIGRSEDKVTITDLTAGLTGMQVMVNGHHFEVKGFRIGQSRTVDVHAAMVPGNTNTITLSPQGRKGGSALVLVHP